MNEAAFRRTLALALALLHGAWWLVLVVSSVSTFDRAIRLGGGRRITLGALGSSA